MVNKIIFFGKNPVKFQEIVKNGHCKNQNIGIFLHSLVIYGLFGDLTETDTPNEF